MGAVGTLTLCQLLRQPLLSGGHDLADAHVRDEHALAHVQLAQTLARADHGAEPHPVDLGHAEERGVSVALGAGLALLRQLLQSLHLCRIHDLVFLRRVRLL